MPLNLTKNARQDYCYLYPDSFRPDSIIIFYYKFNQEKEPLTNTGSLNFTT